MSSLISPTDIDAALNDQDRLAEIAELDLTAPELRTLLQDVVTAAAEHFNLPIGLVSVVLDRAQLFAAMHGIDGELAQAGGSPVEWSFCRYTVTGRDAFVVSDTTKDPLVRTSPLVSEYGVRCYAGIPLITSRGHAIGSLCVIGTEARTFDERELAELRQFARSAMARIESRGRRTP